MWFQDALTHTADARLAERQHNEEPYTNQARSGPPRLQLEATSLVARSYFMLTATKAKVSTGKLLINGQWVEGSGKAFDTVNPATGEVLTQVSEATAKDVDQAVAAARKAFDDAAGPWRKMSASERGKILWRIADLLEKNIEEVA